MLCRTQSIRRDTCFGSSEREMAINHQVVIGIVWESSAPQQRDGGTEESSVGEQLPCPPVAPPWLRHCHSSPYPYCHMLPILFSCPRHDSFPLPLAQLPPPQTEMPLPHFTHLCLKQKSSPSLSYHALPWAGCGVTLFSDTLLESCLLINRCDLISTVPLKILAAFLSGTCNAQRRWEWVLWYHKMIS